MTIVAVRAVRTRRRIWIMATEATEAEASEARSPIACGPSSDGPTSVRRGRDTTRMPQRPTTTADQR